MLTDREVNERWAVHKGTHRVEARTFYNDNTRKLCSLNSVVNVLWVVSKRFRVFIIDKSHIPWCRVVGNAYRLDNNNTQVSLAPLTHYINLCRGYLWGTFDELLNKTAEYGTERDVYPRCTVTCSCPCGHSEPDRDIYAPLVNTEERRVDLVHLSRSTEKPTRTTRICPGCHKRELVDCTTVHRDTNQISIILISNAKKCGPVQPINLYGTYFFPSAFVMQTPGHNWMVHRDELSSRYTVYNDGTKSSHPTLTTLKNTVFIVYKRQTVQPALVVHARKVPLVAMVARRALDQLRIGQRLWGLDLLSKRYVRQQVKEKPWLAENRRALVRTKNDELTAMKKYIREKWGVRYTNTQIGDFIRRDRRINNM